MNDDAPRRTLRKLDRHQSRDLLLLAACYDRSTAETTAGRWRRLRRKLRFHTLHVVLAAGCWAWAASIAVPAALVSWSKTDWLATHLALADRLRRLAPLAGAASHAGCGRRGASCAACGSAGAKPGRCGKVLMHFTRRELAGQPLPTRPRTDDRYELLTKFQGDPQSLGYRGIVVLVDRVDEPHLINGSVEQMRALLWPMLDNKFLKHQGIGFKLLLPIELSQFIDREDRDFYQRARLDKQNMIPSLEWTRRGAVRRGQCPAAGLRLPGKTPSLRELFDESRSPTGG